MADYNALFQAPNAGQAFSQAFQGAQQMQEQRAMRQQQMQRQQQADAHSAMEQHRESIIAAGQVIRQIKQKNPQLPDEQVYAMARQAAIQMGIPGADHAPSTFDPEYYSGLITAADTFAPTQKPEQDPSSVREFEFAKQNGFQGGYTDFLQFVHPPSAVTVPYGAQVQAPGQQGGGMPTVNTPEEAAKLPPGTQFRMPDGRVGTVPGGAGGNASGGFPHGPYD